MNPAKAVAKFSWQKHKLTEWKAYLFLHISAALVLKRSKCLPTCLLKHSAPQRGRNSSTHKCYYAFPSSPPHHTPHPILAPLSPQIIIAICLVKIPLHSRYIICTLSRSQSTDFLSLSLVPLRSVKRETNIAWSIEFNISTTRWRMFWMRPIKLL